MATSPSRDPGRAKPAALQISAPFARTMLGLACSLVLSLAVCLAGFRPLMVNSLLKSAADNYARYCAEQVAVLIGAEADPGYWQYDVDALNAIFTYVMRVDGIARLQVLDQEGQQVLEKTAGEAPDGVIRRKCEIRFNNQAQGWVVVSLAIPPIKEPRGSFGFVSVAQIATLTAHNYATLVSGQISWMMKDAATLEMWGYDAEKLAKILAAALRLDNIAGIRIFDAQGRLILEEGNLGESISGVKVDITHNNNVVGYVQVSLDFPGIRRTGLILQLSAFFLVLLFGAVIYLLPVRIVRTLEGSLLAVNSELEAKVEKRTAQLQQVNAALERELAERMRLEASLVQSEKLSAIGKLAAGVAHDFNNLLTAIMGNAGFLLRGLAKNDPGVNDVKEIMASAERAAGLTQQLLAFSRKQILNPQVIDLNASVGEMVSMLRRIISEEVEIKTVFTPQPCSVRVDHGQLSRVLVNLAVNARDAMPGGGTLTLETGLVAGDADLYLKHPDLPRGPLVSLTVRDTGSGMTDETLKHIFEPFFTTKEKGKGTGLGLPMVFGIIKQSGGGIEVSSEPNRGTAFRIYLPQVEAVVKEREKEKDKDKDVAYKWGETVLLVDDDESLRRMAERLLRMGGYTVIVAADGGAALAAAERHGKPVDLLLTDVVMPGMSGKELAMELARRKLAHRTLYMSGYTDDAIVSHGVLESDIAFINKPFTAEALFGKLRAVLDGPEDQARA